MARARTKLLALVPALAFVFGFLEYGPARGPGAGSALLMLHAVLSVVLVLVWFLIDSRFRGYKASIFLKLAMMGLTVVALPYYLFHSRGLVGGLKALALSTLIFVATMIAYRVGSMFA